MFTVVYTRMSLPGCVGITRVMVTQMELAKITKPQNQTKIHGWGKGQTNLSALSLKILQLALSA